MPNAVLEAMACAKSVLATAVGGLKDLIEDGVCGWLMRWEELGCLSDRIMQCLLDPNAAAMGRKAREKVESRFNLQCERDGYLACYRRLVPGRSG